MTDVPVPTDDAAKAQLREVARATRAQAAAENADAPMRVVEHVRAALLDGGQATGVVAGYWPIGDELDPRPVMAALAAQGWQTALPVVVAKGAPLLFRRWDVADEASLQEGAFGIREPGADGETVTPSCVLVPLLAFDASGHRLGYGGGFYDRTLAGLKSSGKVMAIGIAYAAQEMPSLPAAGHDQRLDGVATEVGLVHITGGA